MRLYLSCGLLLPFWLYIDRIDGPCIITPDADTDTHHKILRGLGQAMRCMFVLVRVELIEMRWHAIAWTLGLPIRPFYLFFFSLLLPLPPMGSTPPAYHSISVSSSGLSHRRAVIAILQRKFLVVPPLPLLFYAVGYNSLPPPRSQSSPTYPCHMNHHRHHHLLLLLFAVPSSQTSLYLPPLYPSRTHDASANLLDLSG